MSIKLPEATYSSPDQMIEVARAAETLSRMFPDHDIEFSRKCVPSRDIVQAPRQPPTPRGTGNRAAVIAATSQSHRTIDEIAEETGLTKQQVRGVINAPTLKFDKAVGQNGATAYKHKSDETKGENNGQE